MTELRPYQLAAVAHLRRHPRSALFLKMGLGKTASTLCALEPEHLPALVAAPPLVARETWSEELEKWRPDLTYTSVLGTPKQREKALQTRSDVYLASRNLLHEIPVGRFKTLIFDELSGFKSPSSARFKAARKLARSATTVWGLTGTPTPEGLGDLWSQLYLLDGGARLERTVTAFRSRYYHSYPHPYLGFRTYVLKEGAEEVIREKISDICMSMSGRVDLPAVEFNRVPLALPHRARRAYDTLRRDLVVTVRDVLGDTVHSAANAAVLTGKLSQLTAGFLYEDDGGPARRIHDQKLEAARETVEALGSSVLMFYRFQEEKEMLLDAFPGARTTDTPGFQKKWNAGEIPVLLAHPASAGHGLNLQYGGSSVVWSTPSWSLEEDEQANARLARPGQTKPVGIHYLTARDTVDTAILDRLKEKQNVQDALLNHLESLI